MDLSRTFFKIILSFSISFYGKKKRHFDPQALENEFISTIISHKNKLINYAKNTNLKKIQL